MLCRAEWRENVLEGGMERECFGGRNGERMFWRGSSAPRAIARLRTPHAARRSSPHAHTYACRTPHASRRTALAAHTRTYARTRAYTPSKLRTRTRTNARTHAPRQTQRRAVWPAAGCRPCADSDDWSAGPSRRRAAGNNVVLVAARSATEVLQVRQGVAAVLQRCCSGVAAV